MFSQTLTRTLVRTLALAGLVLFAWSVLARPSGAHGPKAVYRVKASDTLWSIAAHRYAGDPRAAVWQIESANHLAGTAIFPGERLVLP
jgi:nucleoid-associated protein YgaU